MKAKLTILATIALSFHYAHAAERVWADSAGNTNWTSTLSWVDGLVPSNSAVTDTATFNSVANAQPHLNVGAATRSVNGIDFRLADGGLNFTSDAGAILRLGSTGIDATTQLSGESTVSVTNMRLEGGSHTWNLFSNTTNASTSTFSVSSNIELATDLIVLPNRNSGSGNVGIVNLSGNISESGGIRALTLRGASAASNTINLTGTSSYTGTTTIQQVAATANSLANATVNSALGNSGTVILGNNAAVARLTFQNLSVDGSTDRLLSLRGTLDTQPYILANNDADNTIAFTNSGNTGDTVGTYTTDLIFALGGTNTGNNTFGQVINDRNGTNKTSLRKENPGTWVLTNSNTYTGETIVNGGLLRIDNAAALGGGNLDVSGGVLGLGAGDMTTRAVGTGAGQVQWTGSGGFAAFGAERTVHFGTPGTSINWTATNFIGSGNTLILGHSSADATLHWQQAISFAGSLRTVQVNNGSADVDARMSGNIAGGGSSGLNKTGAGTLELTGASNTYAGATNITAGTLRLGGSNKLPNTTNVTIEAATLDVGAGFTDTVGTLICTGAATINLGTGATLVFADSNLEDWTGGTLNITGDFTNTSIKFTTSGGLSAGQLAVISVNGSGTGTYTLDPSGYLVPGGGGSAYDTWAGGPGLPIDGDANGDGVNNGLAFLLGAANKDENAINRLPTVTQSGGNLVLDFDCLPVSARGGVTFKVEHSTNLADWTATTNVVPDETNAVPDNNVTFEVEAGPVGPPALNSVKATIGSAAADGGKLFARLKAEKP